MLKLDQTRCYGASPCELSMLVQSVALVNNVLVHPRFKELVLTAQFTETQDLTNEQIFDLVVKDMTIGVSYYYKWLTKVIGWTNLGSQAEDFVQTHANRKFWDNEDYVENAYNLIHEANGHGRGFTHQYNWESSVPYTLNRICKSVVDEFPELKQ